MRFYRLSYQDDRYGARTAEAILCERCVDAIRPYVWALTTEQVATSQEPEMCPLCGVRIRKFG